MKDLRDQEVAGRGVTNNWIGLGKRPIFLSPFVLMVINLLLLKCFLFYFEKLLYAVLLFLEIGRERKGIIEAECLSLIFST